MKNTGILKVLSYSKSHRQSSSTWVSQLEKGFSKAMKCIFSTTGRLCDGVSQKRKKPKKAGMILP